MTLVEFDHIDLSEDPSDVLTDEPASWQRWQSTEAAPGSADKLDVLAERARLRLPLFHPRDAVHALPVRDAQPGRPRGSRGRREVELVSRSA